MRLMLSCHVMLCITSLKGLRDLFDFAQSFEILVGRKGFKQNQGNPPSLLMLYWLD